MFELITIFIMSLSILGLIYSTLVLIIYLKEKKIWNKAFSDEIIAKYLLEHQDYLTSAVSKLSGTEYAKIRYVSAVLKNSLRDWKPKVEVVETPKVVVTEEHYETKYKSKARIALEDLEEEI